MYRNQRIIAWFKMEDISVIHLVQTTAHSESTQSRLLMSYSVKFWRPLRKDTSLPLWTLVPLFNHSHGEENVIINQIFLCCKTFLISAHSFTVHLQEKSGFVFILLVIRWMKTARWSPFGEGGTPSAVRLNKSTSSDVSTSPITFCALSTRPS